MSSPLCLVGDKFRCRLNVCPCVQHVTLYCTNHLEPARVVLFHLWIATVGKGTFFGKLIGLLVSAPIFNQKALLLSRLRVIYVGSDPLHGMDESDTRANIGPQICMLGGNVGAACQRL